MSFVEDKRERLERWCSEMTNEDTIRSLISQQPIGGYSAIGYHVERFFRTVLAQAFPTARLVDVAGSIDGAVDMIIVQSSACVLVQVKMTSAPTLLPPSLYLQVAGALRSFVEARTDEVTSSAVLITNYKTSKEMNATMMQHAVYVLTFDLDEPVKAVKERTTRLFSMLLTDGS